MEHSVARRLLADLQQAQNAFYAGGGDAELRAILSRLYGLFQAETPFPGFTRV